MEYRTLILGAGAAGLFAAGRAGAGTLVIDHAKAPGEKIRISGGGRCNFTNIHAGPANFLSRNPHFAKSALARYTARDFLAEVEAHRIPWHEKTLGQLFCDRSAKDIIAMLLAGIEASRADLWLNTSVADVAHDGSRFRIVLDREGRRVEVTAKNLVLATGGKSIPKMGATGLAYDLARQFGVAVTETRPALVPFTFDGQPFAGLSGIATPVRASAGEASFDEALLFTHRGLSGPAMLQISSYWTEGQDIGIDLLPTTDIAAAIRDQRQVAGKRQLGTLLGAHLPDRLAGHLSESLGLTGRIADLSDTRIQDIAEALHGWRLRPTGTEGYRTAEVTLGGIDTGGLSSKTMEAKAVPGLFAIGEAVDVTGWLGGYNFQWAWSSAAAAAEAIRARS